MCLWSQQHGYTHSLVRSLSSANYLYVSRWDLRTLESSWEVVGDKIRTRETLLFICVFWSEGLFLGPAPLLPVEVLCEATVRAGNFLKEETTMSVTQEDGL